MPPTPSTDPAREAPAGLSRAAILVFAIAYGVCVANVYFPQALSPLVATHLHATPAAAALLVTTTWPGCCRRRPRRTGSTMARCWRRRSG